MITPLRLILAQDDDEWISAWGISHELAECQQVHVAHERCLRLRAGPRVVQREDRNGG